MRTPLTLLALISFNLSSLAIPVFWGNLVPVGSLSEKEESHINSQAIKSDDTGLWLLTARITESRTMQKDTVIRTEAGNHIWVTERHVTSRTMTRGQITAVIENQAEDPASEFWFHTDSGEPVSLTVSGEGSHTHSSEYTETIDGKLINATIGDMSVSGSAMPGASLMFYYTPDSKDVSAGITIKAKGSDNGRMFYDEWKDTGGEIDDYSLSCSAGCDASGDRSCNITKTSAGYQATWKKSESRQRHTVDGTEFITTETSLDLTIKPYKEPDKPEVTLYGCSELSAEEQGEVFASGKPEGGKFRFWVEPGSLLEVQSDGESSAIIKGSAPGKGTLYVEYTTIEGKTNTVSQPASCVQIENYNNGQDVPQIPLFDIDGNKLTGKLTIPVSAQPSNIEELVDFVPADKSILSAVGLSGEVELTGSREGKTTLQAKTNCGDDTGPAVSVEVVNCTDETKAKLAEELRIATEAQQQAYKEIANILGSEDFLKAADRIAESTGNLAIKLGGAIIGSLSGGKADAGVKTAAKIYGVGSNLLDFAKGLAAGENLGTVSNLSQMIVELGGSDNQQALASAIETMQAAHDFGTDLGSLIATNMKLKEAVKWAEHWNKYIQDVVRRQKICRDSSEEPKGSQQPPQEPKGTEQPPTDPKAKEQPPKDPVPPKTDPEKPTPQPDKPKPKTDDPAGDDPTGDDPTGDDPGDTENPPVPPKGEPKPIGLPFAPSEDCGCKSSKDLTGNESGLAALESGLTNLGKCVEDFSTGPLTDYVNTLKGWKEVTSTLDNAIKAGPEELKKVAGEAAPRIKLLLGDTKSFDEAGRLFYENFKSCPESTSSGIVLMKSAFNVTVDSVKTKY